jgi:tripartite-type tricarboxylate transporter receptor subunit TctC
MVESGLKGFEVVPWYGILAPAGTPGATVARLNTEIERILRLPDVKDRMNGLGAEAIGGPPERFAAQIESDIAKYAKAVKASGAQVN